ncbi:M23 family metallopeptidase [Microbacterium sp. Leaf436]|uniref:M23 family metallopeptidase n=1 Tax=Microbacterium sp. Leaf436 TaxID=1736377 RepID=UPI0006F201DA|nr:M23 family metallopeptidase [Microbacterium sp. Leaf436]KQT75409.1 hypothetical protein ASG45_02600 [Microbacterium sp. Leaf436]
MQLRDLSDAFWWIRRLIFRVDRLEGGAMLENSSISNGRMRFIGGLLRVDSGGRVEIVGTLQVDGESTVTGQFTVDGPFTFNGDGSITGALTISGPVEITGDVDLTGIMTVTGDIVVTGTGKIRIGDVVIEGGKITAGNVVMEKDKITIGGLMPATLENGEFTLGNGAKVQVGLTGGTSSIGLVPEGGVVDISANALLAWMRALGASVTVSTSQVNISAPVVTIDDLPSTESLDDIEWVGRHKITKRLYVVPPGVGGPGGGFEPPFSLTLVTSEFGMRTHPITGEETMHNGLDFGAPAGTPIGAIGRGVVTESQLSGGFGNLVVVDHGLLRGKSVVSRYAHMIEAGAPVGTLVTTGETVGRVGSTGLSTDPHLHLEILVDGVPVNPREFFELYS